MKSLLPLDHHRVKRDFIIADVLLPSAQLRKIQELLLATSIARINLSYCIICSVKILIGKEIEFL